MPIVTLASGELHYMEHGRLAASLIRGAKLVVMPAGHAPFAEVPDEFLAEVVPFMQRCAGDGETNEG